MSIEIILLMALILFLGYLLKGIIGFGEGSFSISLLALFLDIKFIIVVTLIVVLFADVYLLFKFRKDIHPESIKILVIASFLGVFLGTYFLNDIDENVLKLIIGIMTFIVGIRFLLKKKGNKVNPNSMLGSVAGFVGGFIDAITGTGGAPIIYYMEQINVNKAVFRATLILSFTVYHIARLIGYSFAGILNFEILKIGIYLIPAMLLGVLVGIKLHGKINELIFRRIVAIILLAVGSFLVISFI